MLHHGLGGSLADWRDAGYVKALEASYRLILVDARGHGASDKPHDPQAYIRKLRVGDITSVLDALDIDRAHFVGYSMGGDIGWGIVKYAPERFHSLIIGGSAPYDATSSLPAPRRQQMIQLWRGSVEARIADWKNLFGQWLTPKLIARGLTNDPEAMVALLSLSECVGVSGLLSTCHLPCLLFVGERDHHCIDVQKCCRDLPNATFVALPGLDHVDGFWRADLVLPHIIRFLASIC
jgi:pimeloyl-ACP methyl ester carboxylesterase